MQITYEMHGIPAPSLISKVCYNNTLVCVRTERIKTEDYSNSCQVMFSKNSKY